MNNLKTKVYKRVLMEVFETYGGAKDFINSRIDKICSQENLSAEEEIYFLCFLPGFLAVK